MSRNLVGLRLWIPLAAVLLRLPNAYGTDRLASVASLRPHPESGLQVIHLMDVAVNGNLLFAAGYSGLTVFDISAVDHPRQIANINPFLSATESFYYRLALADGHVYLTRRDEGLEIVDVTDPSSPRIVGRYLREGSRGYETVTRTGDTLCLAAYDSGVELVSIADPIRPRAIATVPTRRAYAAVLRNRVLYVADLEEGFLVYDLADLSSPRSVAADPEAAGAQFLDVDGNLACVAMGLAGVRVYDISRPTAPVFVSQIPTLGSAIHLDLRDGRLAVAEITGVEVFDLSNPRAPVRIGRQPSPEYSLGVAADGDHIYVADWETVQIYRLQDGFEPDLLVEPVFLSFGAFSPGVVEEGQLICTNVGNATLQLRAESSDPAFHSVPESLELEPGEERALTVVLQPSGSDKVIAQLNLLSNDADEPEIGVPLLAGTRDFGPGDVAPDFTAVNALDGRTYSLSGFRGKPVLLTFFAGW